MSAGYEAPEAVEAILGTLYRYRSFSSPAMTDSQQKEEQRRIIAMFAERVFWFANPSTLNDPFDCRPVLSWSDDMASNRRRIEQMYIAGFKRANGLPPKAKEVSRHVSQVMYRLRTQAARNQAFWKVVDQKTGMLCLSEGWDIIQQWTYYAAEHSGFCIEFDVTDESGLSAFRVKYVEERPEIDLIRLYEDAEYAKDLTAPSILTKAIAWQHEREVRILDHKSGNLRIPEGIIKSVTFGINASQHEIDWLRQLCADAKLDIRFYRCYLDDRLYKMTRREI